MQVIYSQTGDKTVKTENKLVKKYWKTYKRNYSIREDKGT